VRLRSVLDITRLTANGLNYDMASDSKFVSSVSHRLLLMSKYSQNALFKYFFFKSEKVAHTHANSL